MKNYTCYHITALAVNKSLVRIPPQYKNLPIEQKAKRGRRPKAPPALVRVGSQTPSKKAEKCIMYFLGNFEILKFFIV
jgi:hypothetical protein